METGESGLPRAGSGSGSMEPQKATPGIDPLGDKVRPGADQGNAEKPGDSLGVITLPRPERSLMSTDRGEGGLKIGRLA